MKYVIIIKIVTTSIVWLFTLPFFYMVLKGGNPDRFREHLTDLTNLTVLSPNQLFDQFLFPGTAWIAILVFLAMNIGWLINKKIHPYFIYLGSFCGIINSIFAVTLSLWIGLGLLLIPGIWFASYLVRWHLTSEYKTTDAFIK